MIVCVCNNVSTRDIANAAASCCSFESLQERLQVGTCCGVCVPCAREAFDEHQGTVRRPGSGRAVRGASIPA